MQVVFYNREVKPTRERRTGKKLRLHRQKRQSSRWRSHVSWFVLAIDSLTYSPGSGWMNKQMSGAINNAIAMAKSPVIEDKGSETARQQQRHKEIRFMSHTSQSERTEKPAQKSQRGKYRITGPVISHSPLIAPCTLSLGFLSFSLMHTEGKHRHFCHLPQASEWMVPWYWDLRIKVNGAVMYA